MKALSIQHPWAHAVAYWEKTVENRTWWTGCREEIAIHASKKFDDDALQGRRIAEALTRAASSPAVPYASGAIIAVATIKGCHDWGGAACDCGHAGNLCSPWAAEGPGQWHWHLWGARALAEPVPCRGALGLWRLPDDVEHAVMAQLTAAEVS